MLQYHWGQLSPLLDLTTGVFPVTQVDQDRDIVPAEWKPISDLDRQLMDFCEWIDHLPAESATNRSDGTPQNHENALIGLAIVARRLEEEKVTAMLDEIRKCLEA